MERVARGRPAPAINDLWYKNAVIYCLSVGTFMDANGDGIGDFEGLMRRLDYLHGLGITAIWLMPFQTSPGRDDGYDVSDYYGVNPAHGTLGDFVEFTHGAKQRGIRVLIDLVVNHTSDEHPWFQEARRDPSSQVPGLVRLVGQEAGSCQSGHGVPRRAEVDLDLRQRSARVVLPPLLQVPAGPQHVEPARPGRDPQDHGLLDPARGVRIPDGCGAVRDRDQGAEGEEAGRAVRHAAVAARVPAVAAWATPSSWPRPTSCPRRTWSTSARTATGCT